MKRPIIAILLAALLLTACAACGGNNAVDGIENLQVIGQGKHAVTLLVTLPDGTRSGYQVRTDRETLGEALREINIIVCDEAGFVTTVDGVTADYSVDQSYWAFYIDGEYATHGVDEESIANGNTYAFEYAKG